METLSALSTINLLPSKKQEVETFAKLLIESVESGNENALHLYIKMNAIAKSFEEVKSHICEYALSEAEKFGAKKFETIGSEISICELGTKYDFTVCNDPLWNEANEQAKKWDEKKKEREKFLKAVNIQMDVIIDGEPMTIQQPIKSSTTGIKISLK